MGTLLRLRPTIALLAALAGASWAGPLLDAKVEEVEVRGAKSIRVTTADGESLVEPNGQPIIVAGAGKCHASYEVKPMPGGFDVLVTLENRTNQSQPRPSILLRGVQIGGRFTHLDPRGLGQLHEVERKRGDPIFHNAYDYPDDLYSPVAMLRNDRFAVGASLIYDLLIDRHSVNGVIYSEGGQFYGTSAIGFDLAVPGQVSGRPRLEEGTTEAYRVTFRFAKPADWQATLEPYREFFRERYGKVRYRADRRPVYGEVMALDKFVKPDDPRGYPPDRRYDQLGWKPMVDYYLEKAAANGYRRVMIWAAAGLYQKGPNYPVEFMTAWPDKLVQTRGELGRLKAAGLTVGHWWGRSGQVSGGWNTGRMWRRDIGMPGDVKAGLAELDQARARGADEVGLDAFTEMPAWQRLVWLERIQKDYPTMRFITESSDCDIAHTMAATFVTIEQQPQPPMLADWLNPGHETWIMLPFQQVNQANFDKLTGWGCVPVTMSVPIRHDAAKFGGPGQATQTTPSSSSSR